VVGNGERRVPRARREELDQEGGDRSVGHGDQEHLDEDQHGHRRLVQRAGDDLHCPVDGKEADCRQEISHHHEPLPADLVGERSEDNEEGHGAEERHSGNERRGLRGNPEQSGHELHGEELRGVPDYALTGGRGEERQCQLLPVPPGVDQWLAREAVLEAEPLPERRLRELRAHPAGDAQEEQGEHEREPPAPVREIGGTEVLANPELHHHRDEEPKGRGDLDVAGVVATLAVRHVLRHVDHGAPVLAAQGEALQQAHEHEQRRREEADSLVAGEETDRGGRSAHEEQRGEEGCLPAPEVAEPAEVGGSDGANHESGGIQREPDQPSGDRIAGRKEVRLHHREERAVQIEVVPLDGRACDDRGNPLAAFGAVTRVARDLGAWRDGGGEHRGGRC
jgi:hypothetical protein